MIIPVIGTPPVRPVRDHQLDLIPGEAGLGWARPGEARHGRAGQGWAGRGMARQGWAGRGGAGLGWARRGSARRGKAGRGRARPTCEEVEDFERNVLHLHDEWGEEHGDEQET